MVDEKEYERVLLTGTKQEKEDLYGRMKAAMEEAREKLKGMTDNCGCARRREKMWAAVSAMVEKLKQ